MFLLKSFIPAVFLLISTVSTAQSKKDSTGLPGDNFDLYGALELFKQSKSPEDFEKAINLNDNEVNNLDLDADGKVDYVKVTDKNTDNSHALVLQVAVSKTEIQDVAVIEIEKNGGDNAHVQIVGDEELYGKNYIIEPKESTAAKTSSKSNVATDDVYNTEKGNNNSNNNNNNNNNGSGYDNSGSAPVVINVWGWPSVQYIYGPAYVGWNSPYYWGYYPGWWQPWQPVYYPVYYRRVYRYHQPYYYRTGYYRCNTAHNYYYGRRMASETVRDHNRSGYYREKQSSYRNNPVNGRRYNNLPADQNKTMNRSEQQRARENNVRTSPQNNNRGTERRAGEVRRQDQPGQQKTEKNVNSGRASEGRARENNAPRDVNRQQSQPKQASPRTRETPRQQQASPGSRGAGAPRGQQQGGSGRNR